MRYYSVSTHYSANTNFFLGASPPDPLIYPSCLHSIDQEIQISNSLWGFSPRPLIYPSFLHSIDHEILLTTAQISNIFRGGGASLPDPPIYPSCLHSINHEILDTTAQISGICPQNNLILEKESYR